MTGSVREDSVREDNETANAATAGGDSRQAAPAADGPSKLSNGLAGELTRIRQLLDPAQSADNGASDLTGSAGGIDELAEQFGLSEFERDLVLLCAGVELDSRFAALCTAAHGEPKPTFGLALSVLPKPHWDALSPGGALRRWRIIELGAGTGLVNRPLRLDERIVHQLLGVGSLDERLDGLLRPDPYPGAITAAQAADALDLAAALTTAPVVVLDGADLITHRRVAGHAGIHLGRMLLLLRAADLPASGADLVTVARLAEREVALISGLILIEATDASDSRAVESFVDLLGCPVVVSGPFTSARVALVSHTTSMPQAQARQAWWAAAFGTTGLDLARHYRFGLAQLEQIAQLAGEAADEPRLRQVCRQTARNGLDGLAERIEPRASWADLVLPTAAQEQLRDIARQQRHRGTVYDDWGMAAAGERGLGITALFAGDSGTGKTLAAEVLARELELDLYRIDLAAVVSKYIGETEKNLKRVFDAAEASGAVLLFDEADALFGKRSEVKDSHDRYANLEISYLLQRMETYRGLAILTTNLRSALDRAFLRRIRFVVTFPFPDKASRAAIWRQMFPPALPVSCLEFDRLAQLQVAGGSIRNIALSAAFLAAADSGQVTMGHLLQAAQREYAKAEKPLTDAEIGGWK